MGSHSEPPGTDRGVWGYLPAQLNTVGELAMLLAALPADTPLELTGTIRVDPAVATTGWGVAAPVASLSHRSTGTSGPDLALQLSLLVLADARHPLPPESGYPLNPLERLHEAIAEDADLSEATAAAAENLTQIVECFADGRFPDRVGQVAGQLRALAEQLVEETTINELEKGL